MGKHYEAAIGTAAGEGAAPGPPTSAGSTAGIPASAQQDAAGQSQRLAPFEPQRRSVLSPALAAPRGLYVRPEIDSDRVGTCMRDAIKRGGYRAALEHYASDEAKASHTARRRLRTKGWLLGRLGLYDQVNGWLDEVASLPLSDRLLDDYGPAAHAAYRMPAMWMETPRPVPRSSDRMLTLEPAASACPDTEAVPGYIWNTMLILDATGPVCSHAGLGAAAFLVGAGSGRPMRGAADGDRRYDPLRGARLHGAPEWCHRWIIADIDFGPWAVGKPHYYYDLTDEGREALDAARATGAPWPKDAEAAASDLEGATLPGLLERACEFGAPHNDLGKMRDELARLLDAWDGQEKGTSTAPVSAEDQALVDLGAITSGHDSDGGARSAHDHLLCLMAVIKPMHKIACEAEPSSRVESIVLEVLIGALQGQCRKRARSLLATMPLASPCAASERAGPAGDEDVLRRPLYSDVSSSLICDLYYCLGEYCQSRNLAVDPCRLPLSERLTADEKAAVIEALTSDNPLYDDNHGLRRGG